MHYDPIELHRRLVGCGALPAGARSALLSATPETATFRVEFDQKPFSGQVDRFVSWLKNSGEAMLSKINTGLSLISCKMDSLDSQFSVIITMNPKPLEPIAMNAARAEVALIKDSSEYTYFKLTSPKLTINRRGKDVVFKKGDPLGWRFSTSGKNLRLISPLHGPNIVYTIAITDSILDWLSKQDPKAPKTIGQLKSSKPEDSANKMLGYVITDGKKYYKLTPKPVQSATVTRDVIYTNEAKAKSDAAPFVKERKLKIKPVFTKDLNK